MNQQQQRRLCNWRSCNSCHTLQRVQWLLVAAVLVTHSATSMTVQPPALGASTDQTPPIPPLTPTNCSIAITQCLTKSSNCGIVHHAYTLDCLKELQGKSPEGLCLDSCRLSLISMTSIIEGYDAITCACSRGDNECEAIKRNTANCWPERLDFNESEFERKRAEFEQQRVDFQHRLGAFEQRRAEAQSVPRKFDEEQPYDPEVLCSQRRTRCKENYLCGVAYIHYGTACRPAIETLSEPCSTQCAASARVLYSVSGGGYFSCICDPNDKWCWRQTKLIAAKCFGFARAAAALTAAVPASGAGPPAAYSSTPLVWAIPMILLL